jgi:hypothetical protein
MTLDDFGARGARLSLTVLVLTLTLSAVASARTDRSGPDGATASRDIGQASDRVVAAATPFGGRQRSDGDTALPLLGRPGASTGALAICGLTLLGLVIRRRRQ